MLSSLTHILQELTANQISFVKFCARDHKEFQTIYQVAICKRYPKVVKLLLQQGVDIDLL